MFNNLFKLKNMINLEKMIGLVCEGNDSELNEFYVNDE